MPIEREIKFSLPPQAARRLGRRVKTAGRWRRRTVSSVYYDTPDERLRRAGVAVRLRRDGARRLQTLKAQSAEQAGYAARAEWEIPAPGGKLDVHAFPRAEIMAATGLDLARVATRLRPLFETRFTRRSAPVALDAAGRAELSVDTGRVLADGRSEPIRELEIELTSGEPRSLLRYAESLSSPLELALAFESKAERGYRLAAGRLAAAPRKWRGPRLSASATPAEAFVALAAASLAQAGANARGVMHGGDPEYLHQMRVGLRRLRSAIRAFRALVGSGKPVVRRLRKLMAPLGEARDWDVFCVWLAGQAATNPALRGTLQRARARRAAARRKAREAVASRAFQRFLLRTLRWLHADVDPQEAHPSLGVFGARSLEGLYRKASDAARDIDWGDARARHALRIRVKRLRYACEFFAASFPRASLRPYLKELEALQDILGELNDVAVARGLLAQLGRATLRAALRKREAKLVEALEPAWAAFERRRPFWRAAR